MIKTKYRVMGKRYCPYCDKAVNLLKEADITFQYFDLDENELMLQGLKDDGIARIPAVFKLDGDGFTYIGGYDQLKEDMENGKET